MDEKINCSITINKETHKITISGLNKDYIEIDYTNDIDFTYLVTVLTEKIDEDKKINFSFEDKANDEKLQFIINTIEEIIEIYNTNLVDNEVVENN